jgi:hypothetical protein
MAIYKRGGVYWYEFVFDHKRVRESTRQGNRHVAVEMQAARRTDLAKSMVGLANPAPIRKNCPHCASLMDDLAHMHAFINRKGLLREYLSSDAGQARLTS